MTSPSGIPFLHRLAHLYGIQTAYYDVNHHRQKVATESLLAVLRSLGAPIVTTQDVTSAWRERRLALWKRLLEPASVAWNGEPSAIKVRLPVSKADTSLSAYLTLENGEEQHWQWYTTDLPVLETTQVEGMQYIVKQFTLPKGLPWGYHRLAMELAGQYEEALLISAPCKAYVPPANMETQNWGVFLPLYSLHRRQSWGSGDFSDMEALLTWVGEIGGRVVATLPLLPLFLGTTAEPSPYIPGSRLLWNEFYLDINKVPEFQDCSSAKALLTSPSFQNGIQALRNSDLIDYQQEMALKRRVLEELSQCFFGKESHRLEDLRRFTEANPVVEDYACFQATHEKYRIPWRSWPQRLREGILRESDYEDENRRYHLYVQWLAHQQIQGVMESAGQKGLQLYLDLPLGAHPDGYDVWREHKAFILSTSVGAPPDVVFVKGQNWLFPPPHPEKIREQGYRYTIACLRHLVRHAGIARIDHVMGLHRLFCIPNGMEASQGVYIRYRAEELYAILTVESHRHKTIIVGEDLGTVPSYVRPAMKRHGVHQMYVVHYELASDSQRGLLKVRPNSVASLNTHDMPPFAAFWQGLDIEERLRLGLLDKPNAKKERANLLNMKKALTFFLQDGGWLQEQVEDVSAILKACLSFLAASEARIVLVNLEDLWLETKPQNVPSTEEKYPNWQRKAGYSFEEFCQMPLVFDTLRLIDHLRKRSRYPQ